MLRTNTMTARRLVRLLVLVSICAIAVSAPVCGAQGGYATDEHPDLGLSFPRARDYEEVPVAPGEKWIILHYGEKMSVVEREKRIGRPELFFVIIDHDPAPEPEAAPEAPATSDAQSKDKKPAEKAKPKKPIDSLESFLEQRTNWRLGAGVVAKGGSDREKAGWRALEYALVKEKLTNSREVGWAYACSNQERTIAILGFCADSDLEKESKIWRYMADRLRVSEPEELSVKDLERHYARNKLAHPEFRIGVRSKLVKGWKFRDIEHFIVIYDTVDQPLMRKVCRDVELLRDEYIKLFPPQGKLDAVSAIRICKDRSEYVSYGGTPTTAGFWNVDAEELVLYDAERKFQSDDPDSFIALYHEAFHQYIHYSAGEVEPHSWFNEGHGDYFAGAQIGDGKVRRIGVNPWRLPLMQLVLLKELSVPWKDILRYEQADYYANPAVCYAQGWSMIYFLRTAEVVANRPGWARILPVYFDTLKSAWAEESAKLPPGPKKRDDKAREAAKINARTRALEEATKGLDIGEIEREWKKFVLAL